MAKVLLVKIKETYYFVAIVETSYLNTVILVLLFDFCKGTRTLGVFGRFHYVQLTLNLIAIT